MIVTAVVSPHPPVLLRELCGAQDTVPELRAACGEAVASGLRVGPDVVVVVGGAAETREWDPSLPIGIRRFGTTDAPAAVGLPQSLGVARRLLHEAGWEGPVRMHSVAWDADRETAAELARAVVEGPERAVLLVMADGSARRGEKAPGHLDERAFAFDDEIGRALEAGDPEALSELDPALAADLLVQGRAALAVLGEIVAAQEAARDASQRAARGAAEGAQGGAAELGRPKTDVLYRDDPHGVMYTVVVWDLP